MTVYEKFYKNDDSFMIIALADYLSYEVSCDECQISEFCKHNSDFACFAVFKMWLQKECDTEMQQEIETWNGIHAQITAPKGTFDKLYNEAEEEDEV